MLQVLLSAAGSVCSQNFDLIPLYGIRVNSSDLKYSGIVLETPDAGAVVRNEIPQNQEFSIVIQNPQGFRDSFGWVKYGLEFNLKRENGKDVTTTPDIFKGTGIAIDTSLKSIRLTNTFNTDTKPGTRLTIFGKLFDRNGSGYISFEYDCTIVASSKRLPTRVFTYYESDSRGMKSASVGLHYNFFEFKGLTGNNFMHRISRKDVLKVLLRGLDGWKKVDGRVAPRVDIELLDVTGKLIETSGDVLLKTLGETMPGDKKELEINYKPSAKLSGGQFYFVWIKISDRNNKKSGMDVVVKFYVED